MEYPPNPSRLLAVVVTCGQLIKALGPLAPLAEGSAHTIAGAQVPAAHGLVSSTRECHTPRPCNAAAAMLML